MNIPDSTCPNSKPKSWAAQKRELNRQRKERRKAYYAAKKARERAFRLAQLARVKEDIEAYQLNSTAKEEYKATRELINARKKEKQARALATKREAAARYKARQAHKAHKAHKETQEI